MNNKLISKINTCKEYLIPIGFATILTFDRFGFTPYEGIYTTLDFAINIYLISIIPIYCIIQTKNKIKNSNASLLMLGAALIIYLTIHIAFSNERFSPNRTGLISFYLACILGLYVTKDDIKKTRIVILYLALILNIQIIFYSNNTLLNIFTGGVSERLGTDISSYNLITYPRILYVTIITCIFSAIIAKGILRYGILSLTILPLIISLSSGGRGPLLAFLTALIISLAVAFKASPTKILAMLSTFIITTSLLAPIIESYFPLMASRLQDATEGDSRIPIWIDYISQPLSLYGTGPREFYAHNIFIEMLFDFGLVGFLMFLTILIISFKFALKNAFGNKDLTYAWILSILILEFIAQQFSLTYIYAGFWAALLSNLRRTN